MLIGFRAGHMGAIYAGCGFAAFSFAIEHFMHNSSLFKWSNDQMVKLIKWSNWSIDPMIKIESENNENK